MFRMFTAALALSDQRFGGRLKLVQGTLPLKHMSSKYQFGNLIACFTDKTGLEIAMECNSKTLTFLNFHFHIIFVLLGLHKQTKCERSILGKCNIECMRTFFNIF